MHLMLILPHAGQGHGSIKNETGKFGIPPMSLPYLASLTTQNYEISIVDENVEEIDFEKPVDLVGISALTMTAPRAYQIADNFKKRGVPVVMAGIHPTMLP